MKTSPSSSPDLARKLPKLVSGLTQIIEHPSASVLDWRKMDEILAHELMRFAANFFSRKNAKIVYDAKLSKRPSERTKQQARYMLQAAIAEGIVIKPAACERCLGNTPSYALHGHHSDYAKPYDVEWLCISCHSAEHSGRKSEKLIASTPKHHMPAEPV